MHRVFITLVLMVVAKVMPVSGIWTVKRFQNRQLLSLKLHKWVKGYQTWLVEKCEMRSKKRSTKFLLMPSRNRF